MAVASLSLPPIYAEFRPQIYTCFPISFKGQTLKFHNKDKLSLLVISSCCEDVFLAWASLSFPGKIP